jgi:hypothetical protein
VRGHVIGYVIIPGRRGVRGRGLTPLIHRRKTARADSNRACSERELNNTGIAYLFNTLSQQGHIRPGHLVFCLYLAYY